MAKASAKTTPKKNKIGYNEFHFHNEALAGGRWMLEMVALVDYHTKSEKIIELFSACWRMVYR
jgi:hypothetical protein